MIEYVLLLSLSTLCIMTKTNIAKIISYAFNYIVIAPIDWFLVTWKLSSSALGFWLWFLSGFVAVILIPLVFLRHEIKNGKIDSWEVEKHRQGIKITLVGILGLFSITFFAFVFSNSQILHFIVLNALILGLVIGSIRIFYKLSVHTALTTASVLLIIYLFSYRFWPLILLIPTVMWARLTLRKHTLSQIIGSVFIVTLIYFTIHSFWF